MRARSLPYIFHLICMQKFVADHAAVWRAKQVKIIPFPIPRTKVQVPYSRSPIPGSRVARPGTRFLYLGNNPSLEPRPHRHRIDDGREAGKTSILFGERASASTLIFEIYAYNCCKFVALSTSVRLSCFTKKRLRLCQVVEEDDQP